MTSTASLPSIVSAALVPSVCSTPSASTHVADIKMRCSSVSTRNVAFAGAGDSPSPEHAALSMDEVCP
ncbi:hypothetical protein RAS1_00030 [Phycisphaerae bacterium RAS1]|nr:hypothetical protein RAS1_00030 [Phycisphaerae bacterium RAS1]